MTAEKDHFLDRSAILALILLALAWFGWDSYMRKKYPPKKPAAASSSLKTAAPKAETEKTIPADSNKEEKTFYLSTAAADFEISSLGMGLKTAHIKGFSDRDGEKIIFKSAPGGAPLFALFFKGSSDPVPFQVRQKGKNILEGKFIYKDLELTKTLFADSKALKAKVRIQGHEKNFTVLSRFQIQKKPQKEQKSGLWSWYSKLLFLPLADRTEAYISGPDEKERLFDGKGRADFKRAFFAGLGSKYFGLGFVNQSSLLPSVRAEPLGRGFQAEIFYRPPPSRPVTLEYSLFAGPKLWENLSHFGNEAASWIDFGFFSWLAWPLLKILKLFYKWFGNWGLAIIALTFLVRLLLLPLNMKSYKSMQVMQKLQPELKALREKYKKDSRKLNEEVLALMRKQKANPAGGCLTGFLQLPVFFALYRALSESVELYQAPFAFWIKDLSFRDPWYALPVLCSVAIFFQQKTAPTAMPPAQARLMAALPWIFSVFLLGLPSGLTLYIFISSVFGAVQQYYFVQRKNKP